MELLWERLHFSKQCSVINSADGVLELFCIRKSQMERLIFTISGMHS